MADKATEQSPSVDPGNDLKVKASQEGLKWWIYQLMLFCLVSWMFKGMWNSVVPWISYGKVQLLVWAQAANIMGMFWAAGRMWGVGTSAATVDQADHTVKLVLYGLEGWFKDRGLGGGDRKGQDSPTTRGGGDYNHPS